MLLGEKRGQHNWRIVIPKEKDMELKLPPIYKRSGKECYLDPIRQKLIYITPEETVRQKVVSYLTDVLEVPAEMLVVEQHLSHYGLNTRKRADIVVHSINEENDLFPIAVVECKAPEVDLDDKARDQLLDYCDIIGANYAMLVNGIRQICYRFNDESNQYELIEELPVYKDMLEGKYELFDPGEYPERISFDELESFLQEKFDACEDPHESTDISCMTSMNIAVPTFNLWEGLLDHRVKMPVGDYGMFRLIEDYGVRMLSYGNASGGHFYGPYRSLLVECNGSTEFYSIAVTTYWKSSSPDAVKTCLVVAHDDEKEAHHALQLVVDENVEVVGDRIDFYHHGRIAIGRMGSGKIDEFRQFIADRRPKLICGKKFYLGNLVNDRLWRMDDPEVIKLIVNLISYAMIRDEYRDFVKNNKK